MTTSTDRATIHLAAGNSIFTVPERIAVEQGIFDRHGIDIVTDADWDARNHVIKDAEKDPLKLFERRRSDTFNMCEWGVLHRLEHSERDVRIAYLRPAVVAQALVTLDPAIQEPHDLAGVEVGINQSTGQHFTTIKLLEGALSRDEIKLAHGGGPAELIDHLHKRTFGAVALMEPFLSLAIAQGAHVLGSFFYRGAQAFATDVPARHQRAFVAAVNEAVDVFNAEPDRYRGFITVAAGGALTDADLSSDYYRFVHAQPYSEERFAKQYAWLEHWDLVEGGRSYDQIIDSSPLVGV
jgi:NitT/TauT family transport system substrate-binding protein